PLRRSIRRRRALVLDPDVADGSTTLHPAHVGEAGTERRRPRADTTAPTVIHPQFVDAVPLIGGVHLYVDFVVDSMALARFEIERRLVLAEVVVVPPWAAHGILRVVDRAVAVPHRTHRS